MEYWSNGTMKNWKNIVFSSSILGMLAEGPVEDPEVLEGSIVEGAL